MKTCRTCNQTKPAEAYRGTRSMCISCEHARRRHPGAEGADMTTLREAAQQAQQALEALEWADNAMYEGTPIQANTQKAITALRTALAERPAEQEQTPDWISYNKHSDVVTIRGRRYSAALFDERGFGSPPGTLLRIVEGPADVVTLEWVEGHPAEQEPVAWWHRKSNTFTSGNLVSNFAEWAPLYTAPQPAIPPGYKLVPEVPTTEWINNLAKTQTGPLEEVPFADIYQCIAELLDTAPEAPQPAKPAEQEPVRGEWQGYTWNPYAVSQPKAEPLTDEEIDNTTRKQVDDLLDHIYEYGTAAEGIDYRVRAIARAIEAAVWGEKT